MKTKKLILMTGGNELDLNFLIINECDIERGTRME